MKRLNFWKKIFLHPLARGRFEPVFNYCFLSNQIITIWPFRQVHEGALVFTEWNSKAGYTHLLWYSFYSRHSFLIYVLLGNYQLVPAHSVSFRVLQIGQNHFSSHIFINFCLIPQSFALIALCDSQEWMKYCLHWVDDFFVRLEFALCWVNKDKKFDGLQKLLSWL